MLLLLYYQVREVGKMKNYFKIASVLSLIALVCALIIASVYFEAYKLEKHLFRGQCFGEERGFQGVDKLVSPEISLGKFLSVVIT